MCIRFGFFPTGDCNQSDKNSTFLFAYSNDLENHIVLDSARSVYNWLTEYHFRQNYIKFANVRFDDTENKGIQYHDDPEAFWNSLILQLPDPFLGFPDKSYGSNYLDVFESFLNNPSIPLCKATIVFLVKRNTNNDGDITPFIRQLQKNHIFIWSISSSTSSGGQYYYPMYDLTAKSNGFAMFSDDSQFERDLDWGLDSIFSGSGFLYSQNLQLANNGTTELAPLTVPLDTVSASSVEIYLNVQEDHEKLYFQSFQFTFINDEKQKNETLSVSAADLLTKTSAIYTFKWLDFGEKYRVILNYGYSDLESHSVEIRMFVNGTLDTWPPFQN